MGENNWNNASPEDEDDEDHLNNKGFGGAVSFNKNGIRSLCVLLIIGIVSILWIGWKVYRWDEGRELRGSAIALVEGRLDVAFARFKDVDERAVNARQYEIRRIDLLSITAPDQAIPLILDTLQDKSLGDNSLSFVDERMLNLGIMLCIREGDSDSLATFLEIAKGNGLYDAPNTLVGRSWEGFQEERSEEAIALLKKALDINPYHREAILLRSQIQALSGNPLEINSAIVSLKEMAVGKDSLGLDALLILSANSRQMIREGDYIWVMNQFKNHPYINHYYKLNDPSILRLLIGLFYEYDGEFALHLSDKLIASNEAVGNDWLLRAAVAFSLKDSAMIAESLDIAKSLGADSERLEIFKSRYLFLNGKFEECLELCLQGIGSTDDNELRSGYYATLSSFVDNGEVSLEQRKKAILELLSWNGARLSQWIRIRSLAWDFWPDRQSEIVESVFENAEYNYRMELATFLFSKGKFKESIQLLDTLETSPSYVSFELRLASLLELNATDDAYQLVNSTQSLGEFKSAFALLKIGNNREVSLEEVNELWKKADMAAKTLGSESDLAAIGNYALQLGEYGKGEEYLRLWFEKAKAESKSFGNLLAGRAYLNRLFISGRTREARELVSLLCDWQPNDLELQFTEAYLNLMLRERLLDAKDTMKLLFDSDPENLAYRVGWAFSNLNTGQETRSLEILNAVESSDLSVYPVLQYAILSENEDLERAGEALKNIEGLTLLPEERFLVDKHLPVEM